jgi:tetratricopeptide (TPR) repeat protein
MTAPRLTSGDWSRALENMDEAMRTLENVPDAENTWSAYMNAGNFYRAVGNTVAASMNVPIPLSGTKPEFWYRKSLQVLMRSEKIVLATNEQYRREHAKHGQAGVTFLPAQLYLEMGRTYLSLSDSPHALAAFERGRALESDPDLLEELAAMYRAKGNLRGAVSALVEALYVDSNRVQIRPRLVELYAEIDPAGCAVSLAGGVRELNTECPLVHGDVCGASENVASHYLRRGQESEAAETRRIAAEDLGCAPAPRP